MSADEDKRIPYVFSSRYESAAPAIAAIRKGILRGARVELVFVDYDEDDGEIIDCSFVSYPTNLFERSDVEADFGGCYLPGGSTVQEAFFEFFKLRGRAVRVSW